jgi:hypothetical protein
MVRKGYTPEQIINKLREAEERLTEEIIALATKYGRYGYRSIRTMSGVMISW